MVDPNLSEVRRAASRARWDPSPVVARAAETVAARAGELTEAQAAPVIASFTVAGFLPASVQVAQRLEAQEELRQSRQADAELAERCERRRAADLALVQARSEQDGQYLNPIEVATGRVTGRGPGDALAAAQRQWAADDDRAAIEARRVSGEKLQFVGDLEDPAARPVAARSSTARAIERQAEAFAEATRSAREAWDTRVRLGDVLRRRGR